MASQKVNSWTIRCALCQMDLTEPGALIFSPPKKVMVRKYHVCLKCWEKVGLEEKEIV